MKRLFFISVIATGMLSFGCSSENKQDEMADSSMGTDTGMMMDSDATTIDTAANTNSTTPTTDSVNRSSTNSSGKVSPNSTRPVNADSVRQ